MGGLLKSKTKSKNSKTPWDQSLDYLLGNEESGVSGILPEAGRIYNEGGWGDNQSGALDLYNGILGQQYADLPSVRNGIMGVLGGEYDPRLSAVQDTRFNAIRGAKPYGENRGVSRIADISGVDEITGGSARQLQGAVNPTAAMLDILRGNVNEYLDPAAESITTNVLRNFGENVMPQIRGNALASGQYGGSRQGIAEGLAASRMSQDLSSALAPMYASAYENAQQRKMGMADALDTRALGMASQNAANELGTQQFNANLGLQNNANDLATQRLNTEIGLANMANELNKQQFNAANDIATQQFNANLGMNRNQQEMAQRDAVMNNRVTGLNALNSQYQNAGDLYQKYLSSQQSPSTIDWQNLANYYNVIAPLAAEYGTTRGKTTQQPSTMSAIMGGLSLAAMPFTGGMSGMMGGLGGGMGGMMGGFGGGMGGGGLNFNRGMTAMPFMMG